MFTVIRPTVAGAVNVRPSSVTAIVRDVFAVVNRECQRIMRDHQQKPLEPPQPHEDELKATLSQAADMVRRERREQEPADACEAHQAFVRHLQGKIAHKLAGRLDDEMQIEIANLVRLLTTMPWKMVSKNRVYFEMAFELLANDQPNMIIVRSLRFDIAEVKDRRSGWIARMLSYFCGDTPLHAVLSGLIVITSLSFIMAFLMAEGHRLALKASEDLGRDLPLLAAVKNMPIAQVIMLVHAAFIGSVVSILVRLRDFISVAVFSSLLIFVSVVTRPFISIMFAIFAFVMMKAGVISFLGIDLDAATGPYLAWGLGFLCGFSERLAQDFVGRASGAFGESPSTGPRPSR